MTDFMNEYCMHTATCGELRKGDVGREVVLCGWAWHNRDHGGLIFVDLRDRAGYTQVVVDPDCVSADDFAKAEHLGREYVLKIAGTVRERGAEAVNPNMATGEIEVLAKSVEVLNTSVTPPFSIEDGIETDETTRMKWRYLDIRRPEMYQALHLRHKVAQAMRGALNERGFLEVETPILANSTPEGARDYIVPSRPNPGRFYALPQSPQQFKQMLMVGGIEALLPDRPLLPRRGPARRPPARVHAGGHRDGLRAGRGRDEPHGGRHGRDAGGRGRGARLPA